jgi:hypothetical protein
MILGSRLGWITAPAQRRCYLPRYGPFPGTPFEVWAGLRWDGKERILPLASGAETFAFCEQTITPTSISISGIDPESRLKFSLTLQIPFRPGDADFSTMPALLISVTVKRLAIPFRWTPPLPTESILPVEAFVTFGGQALTVQVGTDGLDIGFETPLFVPIPGAAPGATHGPTTQRAQHDSVIAIEGELKGTEFVSHIAALEPGEERLALRLAWCAFDDAVMVVKGEHAPFRYRRQVAKLEDVCVWARQNAEAIARSAEAFTAIVSRHSLGETVDHLLAYTFHAWLLNTWWVDSPTAGDWYVCWEGSCYFHSTVDVEYNQMPLYFAIWPELARLLLNEWPQFAQSGESLLGESGKGSAFLCHDIGAGVVGNGQVYPHPMEVEENANYLLAALAYWRRTGDDSPLCTNRDVIVQLLNFLVAADTNANGVPDVGVSNTIDDACPAVQFAREQVYLGVKTYAALLAGIAILDHLGIAAEKYQTQADRLLVTIEGEGWRDDHFLVCLPSAVNGAINAWTGLPVTEAEMANWDSPHIYTSNGLVLLDMIGFPHPLDGEKIKTDLHTARSATLTRYGCRHLARDDNAVWMAMNIWRDMAAAYHKIDFLGDIERYWEWQTTVNSREVMLFYESAFGNQLCFYPRGVTLWGIFDAVAGMRYDKVTGRKSFTPLRPTLQVPLLTLADWQAGSVPLLTVSDGQIVGQESIQMTGPVKATQKLPR